MKNPQKSISDDIQKLSFLHLEDFFFYLLKTGEVGTVEILKNMFQDVEVISFKECARYIFFPATGRAHVSYL
jgi:hypothetical protein